MANRIVSVHAGIYGMGIYAIMLPSSGFSVAHWVSTETSYHVDLMLWSWHCAVVGYWTAMQRPGVRFPRCKN